ncbi:hypothetical protein [Roseibium sp.]|uniref:hypothetical protein n=1 Tax=Roseibium sp. TaxID=1936156 RepID=UPI003D0D96E3
MDQDGANRDLIVRGLVTVAALAMVAVSIVYPDKITTEALVFCGIAVLPWAGSFVKSFKVGKDGLEAELKELQRELHQTSDTVSAIIETTAETEDPPAVTPEPSTLLETSAPDLIDENWRKILTALVSDKYSFRTATGIAKSSGLSLSQVRQILPELREENLVRELSRTSQSRQLGKTQPLWGITAAGRHLI